MTSTPRAPRFRVKPSGPRGVGATPATGLAYRRRGSSGVEDASATTARHKIGAGAGLLLFAARQRNATALAASLLHGDYRQAPLAASEALVAAQTHRIGLAGNDVAPRRQPIALGLHLPRAVAISSCSRFQVVSAFVKAAAPGWRWPARPDLVEHDQQAVLGLGDLATVLLDLFREIFQLTGVVHTAAVQLVRVDLNLPRSCSSANSRSRWSP